MIKRIMADPKIGPFYTARDKFIAMQPHQRVQIRKNINDKDTANVTFPTKISTDKSFDLRGLVFEPDGPDGYKESLTKDFKDDKILLTDVESMIVTDVLNSGKNSKAQTNDLLRVIQKFGTHNDDRLRKMLVDDILLFYEKNPKKVPIKMDPPSEMANRVTRRMCNTDRFYIKYSKGSDPIQQLGYLLGTSLLNYPERFCDTVRTLNDISTQTRRSDLTDFSDVFGQKTGMILKRVDEAIDVCTSKIKTLDAYVITAEQYIQMDMIWRQMGIFVHGWGDLKTYIGVDDLKQIMTQKANGKLNNIITNNEVKPSDDMLYWINIITNRIVIYAKVMVDHANHCEKEIGKIAKIAEQNEEITSLIESAITPKIDRKAYKLQGMNTGDYLKAIQDVIIMIKKRTEGSDDIIKIMKGYIETLEARGNNLVLETERNVALDLYNQLLKNQSKIIGLKTDYYDKINDNFKQDFPDQRLNVGSPLPVPATTERLDPTDFTYYTKMSELKTVKEFYTRIGGKYLSGSMGRILDDYGTFDFETTLDQSDIDVVQALVADLETKLNNETNVDRSKEYENLLTQAKAALIQKGTDLIGTDEATLLLKYKNLYANIRTFAKYLHDQEFGSGDLDDRIRNFPIIANGSVVTDPNVLNSTNDLKNEILLNLKYYRFVFIILGIITLQDVNTKLENRQFVELNEEFLSWSRDATEYINKVKSALESGDRDLLFENAEPVHTERTDTPQVGETFDPDLSYDVNDPNIFPKFPDNNYLTRRYTTMRY